MAVSGKIEFLVQVLQTGMWKTKGKSHNMSQALKAADKLYDSRKYAQVKVDQHFTDNKGRTVVTTIFDKKVAKQKNTALTLLLIAIMLGFAMYFITGAVVKKYFMT